MTIKELLSKVKIDGKPVPNVLQIQADELQTTIVWGVPQRGSEPVNRVITVESEAVEIG